MTYDFSKAQDKDIVVLRDRTQAALNNNPTSENAPAWREYIDQANAELKKRSSKVVVFAALGILAFVLIRK